MRYRQRIVMYPGNVANRFRHVMGLASLSSPGRIFLLSLRLSAIRGDRLSGLRIDMFLQRMKDLSVKTSKNKTCKSFYLNDELYYK